jgi:hypothetical protein
MPFQASDVGKSITIPGAGSPGGAMLVTTIRSFTDAGHVTLDADASAAASDAFVSWGTDDTAAWQKAMSDAKAVRGTLLGIPGRSFILRGLRIVDASFTFTGVSEVVPVMGGNIPGPLPGVVAQDCFTLYCPTDNPILDWDISWNRTGSSPSFAIGKGAVLRNVLLLGSFAGPNQHGMIAETQRLDMHGVYTNNTGGNGFMIRDQNTGLFTKCLAYNFQGDGWVFDDTPKPGEEDAKRACTFVSLVQCGALGGQVPGGNVPGATGSAVVLRNGVNGCKFSEFDSEQNDGYAIRLVGYSDYVGYGDNPTLTPPASFAPRPARSNKFDQHWDELNLKGILDFGSRNGSRYNKIFLAHATSAQPGSFANGDVQTYGTGNMVWQANEHLGINNAVDLQQVWAIGFSGAQFSVSDAYTINVPDGGSHVELLLQGNVMPLSIKNGRHRMRLCLVLIQDGTGGRTVTWSAAFKWQGGLPPTVTPGAGKRDIFWFYYDQTTSYWYEESRSQNLG